MKADRDGVVGFEGIKDGSTAGCLRYPWIRDAQRLLTELLTSVGGHKYHPDGAFDWNE